MKNSIVFTLATATLGLALSAHAVQATGTSIGLVIKPMTPVVAVIKPTQTLPGSAQTTTGPKVRPMATTRNAPPVQPGR
jgi:hypothetical protein